MKKLLDVYDSLLIEMLINESKVKHKLTNSKQLNKLYSDFIQFVFEKYKIENSNARVMITRINKNFRGYVDIAKVSEKDKSSPIIKVNKDLGANAIMKIIAHETTHAKQIIHGDLWYTDTSMQWKGKDYISLEQYQTIVKNLKTPKNLEIYNNFPWEVEAMSNEVNIVNQYKESDNFKILMSTSDDVTKTILNLI